METSLDLLAWRASLAGAAPVPLASDLTDWVERLTAAGLHEGAMLLSDVAAIHQGFSPQARASRQGSSLGRPFGRSFASTDDGTMTRATADLQQLAGRVRSTPYRHRKTGAPIDDVADAARLLRRLLEQEWHQEEAETLAATLAGLVLFARRLPMLDHRSFAFSPWPVLVPVIATLGLVDFALSTRDLWDGPLGSPELLHQAARLDDAGLGAYLGNVGRLVRDSRDVVDLAHVARRCAAEAGAAELGIEHWVALLSRGCSNATLREIVDDLGDVAAGEALSLILDRVASRPAAAIDLDMVMRLRDAGLDNGDYALAVRAQQVIVRLRPDSKLEGVILGSIEASGGEFARAEATLRPWLALFPEDEELRARLEAAERGRFDRFVIPHGYASPPDRREIRLRRRGVTLEHPRRRGERLRAVDVG